MCLMLCCVMGSGMGKAIGFVKCCIETSEKIIYKIRTKYYVKEGNSESITGY